jgi:hypothetical protein
LINKISKLIKSLKYFNDEIKTARGNKLNNTILNILSLLDEIENFETDSNNRISPLINLIDKIKDKFSIFDKNDKKGLKNYFQLLKWCKEHKLVQQGLVIFRENMISTIADEINEPYLPEHMKEKDYDYTLIEIRDEIGNALYSLIEEDQEYNPITNQEKFDFIRKGIKENFNDFLALYDKFRYKRNDVSHFGLSENSASQGQKVIDNFDNYTDELQQLLEEKY